MENHKGFFSISQVAKMLGISRVAVYKQVKKGKIDSIKVGKFYAIPKTFFKKQIFRVKGRPLGDEEKIKIEKIVDKTFEEYGEVIKKLGDK